MRVVRSRFVILGVLVIALLLATACEFTVPLPSVTPSASPEPTATITPTPTATPRMPDGPYPPVVIDYTPRMGQEVAADTAISIRFDQPMNRSSVVAALRLSPEVEGDLEWQDDTQVTFRPAVLSPATRYRVAIGQEAHAVTGLPLSAELAFAFSTLSPLKVTQVGPSNGATGVRIDAPVLVAFNRAIVPLHCVGVETGTDCSPLPLTFDPAVLGDGTWINTSLYRFDSLRGWGARRTYQVTLTPDFTDVEGTALAEPVVWSFTTASPTLQLTAPVNGAKSVPLATGVKVVFNTPMDREATGSAFNLTAATGEAVPGAITWMDNGAILVFAPTQRLRLGTQYTVRIGPRARAATSVPLENPRTWTFTTVQAPAVVSMTPADEAVTVRVHEPVRITFAGAIDARTFEERVLVTPTQDSLYTYFDTGCGVYNLSWEKAPRTEYCVTALPGIADVYGNAIEARAESCFVTGDLDPFFGPATHLPALTLDASAPAQLQFLAQNRNSVDFTLSRLTEAGFIRGWNVGGTEVRSWTETLLQAPRNTMAVAPVDLSRGRSLSTGYYELAWENPPWGTQSIRIGVVDRHVMLKLAAEEAVVWVTNLRSGEPISRTAVRLVDQEGLLIAAGTTDTDGLAHIPISPREDLWESVAAIVGEASNPGFGVALTHWMGDAAPWAFDILLDGSAVPPFNVYLYTDRPIYRPGQMVHFRGILREKDVGYRMPSLDMTVAVVLRDPFGEEVYSDTLSLSEFGTFAGAVILADDTPLGDYTLAARLPTVADDDGWSLSFNVADYRKPEFEVSVTPEHDDVLNGESLRALVTADYFFGEPVSGTKVEWVVRAGNYAFHADVSDNWQLGASHTGASHTGASHTDIGWGTSVVAEGEAVTDADGRFVLELPADLQPLGDAQTVGPQRWTVEATIFDESGFPVGGQAEITVHPARFILGLNPQHWVVSAGTRTEIDIIALDWSGLLVAEQEISVALVQRAWRRVVVTGTSPSPVWVYTDTNVSKATVTTDIDGKAVVTVTPPRSGNYVVVAETTDVENNPVRAELTLWVGGVEAAQWQVDGGKITPVADASLYQVGDTARILVPTPFDGPYQMLITVERDGILEVERRVLENANPIVEIPILQDYLPNVYVSFVVIRAASDQLPVPDVRAGYVTLNVEPQNQTLTVEIVPDKSVYGPGDSVELTLRAVDAANHRVDAEISVAVVDKAVLSLQESSTVSILDAFYGARPLRVVTGDSLLVLFNRVAQRLKTLSSEAAFLEAESDRGGSGLEGSDIVPPQSPRRAFPDTVLWEASVRTGDARVAKLNFDLPDSLTTWIVEARAVTLETQVGEARAELVVTKPLLVRSVTPRFFVAGDRPEVAAVIHNNTDVALDVTARLNIEAGADLVGGEAQVLTVPARGRARVAWTLSVLETSADAVALTFSVEGGGYSDVAQPTASSASEAGLPVYRYVSPDVTGTAGVLSEAGRRVEAIIVPPEAGGDSVLVVHTEPSLAGALIESLQVLEQYPYATTDVLVGRFLPNVFTYRALQELQIKNDGVATQLTASIADILERLYARQNVDGGWGWWMDWSNLHLSTYATLGLVKAQQAGFAVRQDVLDRALAYVHDGLVRGLEKETRYPYYAFALYVLSESRVSWPAGAGSALYAARDSLGLVGRAYLALAYGRTDPSDTRLLVLLDELRSVAEVTATGAHWESDDKLSWNTDTVATAIVLNVLANFAPDDPLLEPAVRWLMIARRADRWETTYETTWAVVGLSEAMRVTGDFNVGYDWRVALNGGILAEAAEIAGTSTTVWGTEVGIPPVRRSGVNVLEIVRGGGLGQLYYTAHLHATLPVDEIAADSRGMQLRREYCAVQDVTPSSPSLCVLVKEIRVGDVVEVRLTLVVPRVRQYVMLEDSYPAGMEPLEASNFVTLTSTAETLGSQPIWWRNPFEWQALRDKCAVYFTQEVMAGTYQIAYRLRAVVPGTYHALPATVTATYFPEIWGRTDGQTLVILPAVP